MPNFGQNCDALWCRNMGRFAPRNRTILENPWGNSAREPAPFWRTLGTSQRAKLHPLGLERGSTRAPIGIASQHHQLAECYHSIIAATPAANRWRRWTLGRQSFPVSQSQTSQCLKH